MNEELTVVERTMPTWKERLIAKILLMVARMFATGDLSEEIRHLSNHITVSRYSD